MRPQKSIVKRERNAEARRLNNTLYSPHPDSKPDKTTARSYALKQGE